MNIGIIGAGSIGLLFGAYLGVHHKVTMFTKTIKQADMLKTEGINLHTNGMVKSIRVNALPTENENKFNQYSVVIVSVKQYHLPTIIPLLQFIPKHVTLLFVQNGMGHIDLLRNLSHHNIMVGVVEHGALKLNDITVKHTGIGLTKISNFKGNTSANEFVTNCSTSDFTIQAIEDWNSMLLTKLVINSMINPLSALLRVENGQLVSNPHFYQIFKELFQEIICLLKPNHPQQLWESVQSICEKTARNRSSMLRDVEQNKDTEIEGILGYYRNLPDFSTTHTPILDFLYQAIKGIEEGRGR
ncbi:2-dehydropantoate 2-reductase [Bacillus pinisoli]|uniref:2-dehydropantoate 2-reductase n=1 Tax=Bacillus pinisoli TaxID=2901866 RepID=UPI001FF1050D|nr:2-dehydropantoate 2-reductase [Bacillus pinisoli]